jgi:hypothetical protein
MKKRPRFSTAAFPTFRVIYQRGPAPKPTPTPPGPTPMPTLGPLL